MLSVPDGYRLGKRLSTSARSELYAGVRAADGMAVVLKRFRDGRADRARCARREYELLRKVAAARRIPRALELDLGGEDPLLVLEALPGVPLASLLQSEALPLDALIAIGLQLADTLEQIHAARVIHRDVTPRNVLVERGTWAVSLIDFGIACELGAAQAADRAGDAFEGTPHYVAPEQTGWLNRGCDARSDLYSLGATLYHACTGSPPFPELDAAELMHAHLARVPRSPRELRPDLPAPLADLVLKLLRKEPEERYQRARALHADLAALREQLQSRGSISGDFELGSAEIPERPRFSRKLHGRAAELAVLRSAYARSAAGSVGLVLIAGEPGAGKSALVEALRPEMTRAGARVACAKFDPFRDRPYAGWAEALGALVQQLLVESTARLERCKAALESGLGGIAQALIDLVPDLAFLLEEVQPVPPLGPAQTQTRLALALQRFTAALATPGHPLVLFLDDLQWSDAGTRALLEELLSNLQGAALLLIGAYRTGDVGRDHPLTALCERLERRGVSIERIGLGALDAEAAESLLADALERPRAELRSFAACVARKTGNVPFLIQQFVLHMHSLGLVRFAPRHGWTWNDAAIAAADIPDGAVALMVSKLERLDRAARELIEFASCVGDSFDVELLADLSGRSRESIEAPLYLLAEEGLIAPAPTGFRFAHGRIREAAQSLLTPDALSRLHWDTGRLLLEHTPEEQRAARLFETVEHLNRGRSHLDAELRVPLIELNLQAGKRALRTGAGSTAGGYLAVARELFAPHDWQERRELGFDLYFESAESAFQSSAYDDSLAFLSTLDQRSPSPLEYARIETARVRVLALVQQPEAVLRHALRALRRLGLRWSEQPSRLRSRLALLRVRLLLRGRNPEDALRPASAPDPRGLAQLLAQLGATFLRVGVHHAVQANSFMMRRFLRHGYTRSPGFTVSGHAVYYLMFTGDAERTRRLVESVRRLNERVPDPVYTLRAELTIQAGIDPWIMRRRRAVGSMDAVAALAREIGDREGEFQSRFLRTAYLALAGDPVLEIEQSLSELAAAVQRCGALYPEPEKTHAVYRLLRSGAHDVERRLAESDAWIARHPTSAEPYLRTFWLLVLCVFGRHDLAFAQSEAMGERLFRVVPFVHVADHTFYRGIAAAALAADSARRGGSRHRRALARCRKLLRRWARNGPDFVHMARILDAEHARLRGRHDVARSTFEHAAREALEQQYVHHAALAHERRASLLVALRRETEASAALQEAAALYRDWGVTARVAQLESRPRP